jgi:hypothetical protein
MHRQVNALYRKHARGRTHGGGSVHEEDRISHKKVGWVHPRPKRGP